MYVASGFVYVCIFFICFFYFFVKLDKIEQNWINLSFFLFPSIIFKLILIISRKIGVILDIIEINWEFLGKI